MTGQTIDALLAALQARIAQLEQEYRARQDAASYAGEAPGRDALASSHLADHDAAAKAAGKAFDEAKRRFKHTARAWRRSHPISMWFSRHIRMRSTAAVSHLPAEIRDALRDYRAARADWATARQAYLEMTINAAVGPLSEAIAEEHARASSEHEIASVLRRIAVDERAALAETHRSLGTARKWLSREGARLDGSRTLTDAAANAVRYWIETGEGRAPEPVLRVEPDNADHDHFRRIAAAVSQAWIELVPTLPQTITANPQVVRNMAGVIGTPMPDLDGFPMLQAIWEALAVPGSFDPDVKALLYWVAATAEVAMIRELTAKTDEEPTTTLLLSRLADSSTGIGKPLFEALGYGKDFPFHIALYETDKVTEAETGADFGVILHLGLDDREICRAALLQAKLAKNDKANIHRKSETRGNMHQLAALTRRPGSGYYLFLDKDPVTGPPAAVVPADSIAARLTTQHGVAGVTDLAPSQCNVTCSTEAVDFGTFFGFTLLEDGLACSSIPQALRMVGGTQADRIAAKLMIIRIGRPPLEKEIEAELKKLGYRESRLGPTIAEMAWRAGLGRGHGL